MPLSDSNAPSDNELRAVRQRRGPADVTNRNARNGGGLIRKEFLFKILVIGELGAGKTSFIKRYVHNLFSEHYRATIGVDFALKVFTWDDEDNTIVRLQLWDIAGQERFGNMTRVYYKDALGAIIVYDVTRRDTFKAVDKWKSDLDSKVLLPDGRPIPCILVGNKADMKTEEELEADQPLLKAYCQQKGFIDAFCVSAKNNTKVEEACMTLVRRILENEKWVDHSNGRHGQNGEDRIDGASLLITNETDGKTGKKSKCFESVCKF